MNWDQVVDEAGPLLYKYFDARFGPVAADDLTQECLFRLVEKCSKGFFRPSKGTIIQYAFGIARFIRLEYSRSDLFILDSANVEAESEQNLETELDKATEKQQLRRAISNLPDIQQEVLLMSLNDEMTLQKIANCLGMPLGTVKSHIHRAKTTLTEDMKRWKNG